MRRPAVFVCQSLVALTAEQTLRDRDMRDEIIKTMRRAFAERPIRDHRRADAPFS